MIEHLNKKNKIVFITTSNRREGSHEVAKSTQLAHHIAYRVGEEKIIIHDIPQMKIYPCEGNVSWLRWNGCGMKESKLSDPEKNPSWCHRCRASINNPDDELRKISKTILEADAVLFFTSVRRGQTNSIYQNLMERLTRIENRHSTLGEDNIVKNVEAGIIVIGHNRNNEVVLETQKQVLEMFGFKVPKQLSRGRTFTNMNDETQKSYKAATGEFEKDFWFSLDRQKNL